MSVEPRLIQTDGYAVMSGVQMLIKAALESGADTLIGSHLDGPGHFVDLLSDHTPLLSDKGVQSLVLPDARQAIASLRSAWLSGRQAVGVFDARGVVDAAAALLAGGEPTGQTPGGVVLGFGPCDSEMGQAALALLRRSGWVVIEPALQDEVKSYAATGLGLSKVSGRPVALALPSAVFNGAATVSCKPNTYPGSETAAKAKERVSENIDEQELLRAEAQGARINTIINPSGKGEDLPLGLITVGRAFGWTRQAMADLGLVGRIPTLRLGMLTPLDEPAIVRHVSTCQRVLVLDPSGIGIADAIEQAMTLVDRFNADDADAEKTSAQLIKIALDSNAGTLGVIEALRPWLEEHPGLPNEQVRAGLARIPERAAQDRGMTHTARPIDHPPPGSSLVDVSVVLGRLRRDLSDTQHMLEHHRRGPMQLSIFGELDDAARLLLSRWDELAGGLECDGRLAGAASASAGSGDAQRSVVLMTSRRFFSLGASAIADAVRAGRNTVFLIHTEDPAEALGPRKRWQRRPKVNALDMQAIVEGVNLGRRNPTPSVTTIDPSDRPRMRRLLERLLLSEGVHVVIARRRRGPRYYRKASEVHQKQSARRGYVAKQGCLVHCPEVGSLTPRRRIELGVLGVETTEGGNDPWTVSVSWSWHDETIMHALSEPAVGLAILERNKPERSRVVAEDLDQLPEPPKPMHANQDAWRAVVFGVTGTALDLTLRLMQEAGAAMGYLVRSTLDHHAPEGPTPVRADVLFTSHEQENAPHVPAAPGRSTAPMLSATDLPGQAELVLGTELTQAAEYLASCASTDTSLVGHALVDQLVIPGIDVLSTGTPPDLNAMLEQVREAAAGQSGDGRIMALPIARLAEWLWGHQRYAAWVYLGYLVQRGLVPLTIKAINTAGQRVLGITDPRSSEAIKVGRRLAIDPAYAQRALQQTEAPLNTLLPTLADDLAERAGSRRGSSLSGMFLALTQPLLDNTASLDDATRRRILTVAQRCVYWAGAKHGPAYCERMVRALEHVLSIDDAQHDYALTRAAVLGLERAMLIPDEVYLAALLTAPQRYRRDRRRLNISLERGDKVSYVHLLRPEFDFFKRRVGFTVTLGERAIKTLAGLHLLRRIRPGWYRTQRAFRDLYLRSLADLTPPQTEAAYQHALEIVASTAGIRGRGDVRRDSVLAARRRLEKLVSGAEDV